MNTNSIYLAGSNQQLILTNATNSLSRTVGPTYASTINTLNPNQQITMYEIRKSKRSNNNQNAGTIRTATYVSPNGTHSRINIITDVNNQLDFADAKQQQISGLQNPRHLSQLIGFSGSNQAQPNDYCASGKIGVIHLEDNGTIKSSISSSQKNGHYLIPLNTKFEQDGGEVMNEQQHLYFQHMGNTYVPSGSGTANINFNYSSSDTENDSSGSNGANPINGQTQNNFNHMNIYNMSKRQIYTTNSFGRQQVVQSKVF